MRIKGKHVLVGQCRSNEERENFVKCEFDFVRRQRKSMAVRVVNE